LKNKSFISFSDTKHNQVAPTPSKEEIENFVKFGDNLLPLLND
jgi:hypothetical protein